VIAQMVIVAGLAFGGWPALAGGPAQPRSAGSGLPADTGKVVRLTLAPEGNEARYRVREQLVSLDFPNDAVGATSAITGSLALDAEGRVVPAESQFVIDVTTLKSDRERRDGYLQRRTLETAQYPTVTLVPTALHGLPWPLPASGTFAFEMDADLTIKGVTRPVRGRVEAAATPGGFSGTASTRFTFDTFALTKPRVSVVLSVVDEIRLEYDFHLVPDSTSGS
jgi:polyisoprenoid-binding protein YceI